MKVGILYICTGNYIRFWDDFFRSSESLFLSADNIEKHYFVFSSAESLAYGDCDRVHLFHQEQLPWPLTTLYRFKIFQKARAQLEEMDFLFFFNANMRFLQPVGTEILPRGERDLAMLRHPLLDAKPRSHFTYEKDPRSLAFIRDDEGENYFMGALNGGTARAYLQMIDELERRIDADEANGVMAVWHDESHLNRFAIDFASRVLPLDSSYGYAEGRQLPYDQKILILDKSRHGGHKFLRGQIEKDDSRTGRIYRALKSIFGGRLKHGN